MLYLQEILCEEVDYFKALFSFVKEPESLGGSDIEFFLSVNYD